MSVLAHEGGVEVKLRQIGVAAPVHIIQGERLDPRNGLNRYGENHLPPQGYKIRTVQPVA